MKNYIWVCAALMATLFVTGESLICSTCKLGLLGKCWLPSERNCDKGHTCFRGEKTFNRTRATIHQRGCISTDLCNKTESGLMFFKMAYTINRTCCNTDLCNGAPSMQLPVIASFGAALVAMWSIQGL